MYVNIYRYHLNQIYWVPLPNNLSYTSEERNIPVCLVSKQPEKSYNLLTKYLRLFGHPYWHSFWILKQIIWDYFRSDKAVSGWTRFSFLEYKWPVFKVNFHLSH